MPLQLTLYLLSNGKRINYHLYCNTQTQKKTYMKSLNYIVKLTKALNPPKL